MLVVKTIAKIRRAHFIDGKSIKQIWRELRLSRNTVRKVIRSGATEGAVRRIRTSLCWGRGTVLYAAQRPRHSARAAVRLRLK